MKTKFLTDQELQNLKQFFWKNRGRSDVWLLIELMIYTGCRGDEAIRIRPCDISPDPEKASKHRITIYQGSKGSNARRPRIDPFKTSSIAEALMARANAVKLKSAQPFIELASRGTRRSKAELMRYHWRNIAEEVFRGTPAEFYTLHCLRHTFCRRVFERSKENLERTRLAMGHKSITSTQHYLTFINYENCTDLIEEAS